MATKRVKKYEKIMTHQIPPHLAFCTLGQNQKAEQGTNLETLKRDKQTQKHLHISQWIWRNERNGQHPMRKELKNQDSHENHPSTSNMAR